MKRALLILVLCLPFAVRAEAMWLTSHARLLPAEELGVEAFVGTRSVGAGVTQGGFGGELAYFFLDRFVELRGARVFPVRSGFATVTVTTGVSAYVVPDAFDVGLGPVLGLNLGLGGERFQFELGLQTGIDAFFRGWARFPERGVIGFTVKVERFTLGLQARLGVDLELGGRQAPWEGEAVLSVRYDFVRAALR